MRGENVARMKRTEAATQRERGRKGARTLNPGQQYFGVVETVDTSGEVATHTVAVCVVKGGGAPKKGVVVALSAREVNGEAVSAGTRVLAVRQPGTQTVLIARMPDAANVADKCIVPLGVTG